MTAPRAVPLPPLVPPAETLTREEVQRYSRHVLLPGVGMQGQQRLKNARVLVVGAGGLGSPTLSYLAAAGVGVLGVADDDTVEVSNLQRQVIHGVSRLGMSKVDSAAASIAEINPLVHVRRHALRLETSTVRDVVGDYDLVLDGTDSFASRYVISDACTALGVPCIWGSVLRFDGQVSLFWSNPPGRDGVTYRDVFGDPPPDDLVPSCAEAGVFGALCAAVGAVMAMEAVKLVCGLGEPLLGRLLVFDALDMSWRSVRVRAPSRTASADLRPVAVPADLLGGAVPADPSPDDLPHIEPAALADLLASDDRRRPVLLVDVREPMEREIVAIAGSVAVPLARFRSGQAWDDLRALGVTPGDRSGASGPRLVLYCKSGARSAQALAAARQAGWHDAVHLGGGVLAWVREVEPHLPTY